ncbi:carbon monoxide dehydrogenase [Thiocystis minor]|nr:carbon monoxide dehydrogenase [Thiocystis minor]
MLEIGASVPRADAWAKVIGAEHYAIDHYPLGLLWAGARRAGLAHARLRGVAIEAARALPGVVAVLTAADVPGTNRQGIVHKDQPVLVEDHVRHWGDPVALVLAEDRETLRRALALVEPDLEPLPGVFDIAAALRPDAPTLHPGGNVLLEAEISTGDTASAWDVCAAIVEGTFDLPFQDHGFLETQNGVAQVEPDGILTLTVSTQAPFRDRFEIAHALGLDPLRIRVISPYLGGAFGGKDGATVQCLLALAALHVGGRPVKMVWEREECMIAGYKRHAARLCYRLGALTNGTLHALDCQLYFDTGAYAHLGGEVMELGLEHAGGPYRIAHTRMRGWAVYTNNPIGGAMRGFGVCQASFGFERMLDRLAAALGRDRLDLRRQNALRRGDRNAAGVTLVHSTGLAACLETLSRHPLWLERDRWPDQAPPLKRRGVGVAAVFNAMGYGRGLPDAAIAKIALTPDGRFRVDSAVSDMGQGNASAFAQIAGQILCQRADAIELVQPDTARALPSGSSSAGRTTYSYGNALVRACEALRAKLLHRASLLLMVDEPSGLALLPGRVRHLPTGRDLPLARLAAMLPETDRVSIEQFVMPVSQEVPDTGKAFVIGFPHVLFAYAAHLAYVEIDTLTGKLEVCRYLAVTDGGRVLNPRNFDQQIQGAVAQGIGYALCEELRLQEGRILNPDFARYLLPTSLDVPDIASLAVATVEDTGPFGMKGIGEVGINGPLPAIASAVEAALGRCPSQSPLEPRRLVAEVAAPSASDDAPR